MRVTLFDDVRARDLTVHELAAEDLYALILQTHAPTKHDLPLLKLAAFGDRRSDKGSLRHDNNVLSISGLECDYDAERMSFDEATSLARASAAECILYTSPSHTPDAPRWRALFPFAGEMTPPGRTLMADRANAIFNGVLARETWTLSQAFYFGSTSDNFQSIHLEGTPIDALDLPTAPYEAPKRQETSLDDLPPRIRRAIRDGDPSKFGFGQDRSRLVFYVASSLVRAGWDDTRIADLLTDRVYPISAHTLEQSDPGHYASRQAANARKAAAEDWDRTVAGQVLADSQANVKRALQLMSTRFTWDTRLGRGYVNGAGPLRVLDDHEVNELRLSVDRDYHFRPTKDFFYDVVDHLTHLTLVDPVAIYLDRMAPLWDGQPRIGGPDAPSWLTYYGGAEDTPYTRAVGRLILLAACRRTRAPGCKFDEMLVFVDPTQGTGKSTVLQILAVEDDWFTDSLPLHARDKETIEHLSGRWIVECGELNGMRHSDVDELKTFLARRVDRARLAYGRLPVNAPRRCVFFGTTNSDAFLRDRENRRFWPVRVKRWDLKALEHDRDQLWAEAAQAEARNESIRLEEELWGDAAEVQSTFRQEEPWASEINDVIKGMDGKISSTDVWKIIGKPLGQRLQHDNQRLGEAMRELGFERVRARMGQAIAWCYRRPADAQAWRTIFVHRDPLPPHVCTASFDDAPTTPNTDGEDLIPF